MRIDILSAVPNLLQSPLHNSILKRAQDNNLIEIYLHDLHHYGKGKYRQIDDYPYGGGAGMVLMCEPIAQCLDQLMAERKYDEIIFPTPDAPVFNQSYANKLSMSENLVFICGHYKGIDERIREKYVTLELSLGDFVLTGGEIATCAMVDSIVRLIPGAISDEQSALSDSFQDQLLSPPVYTRPAEWREMKVPEVLLSGNFQRIDEWNQQQALKRTQQRKPDLLDK